jgi:predicted nucleic acid-binding protein
MRIQALDGLELLEISLKAVELAETLVKSAGIPERAAEDALHIAICATNGIEFLVTWNCRHIANATLRAGIERVCRAAGLEPPIICTPEEMAGNYGGEMD